MFRARKLPVIQIKEVHRPDMVDFGRELDGSEGIHCMENSPLTDYAQLTYPIEGEYLISKRRYSAFFGTIVTDAVVGSSLEAHNYALKAIQYLQRDARITATDVESAL